MDLNKMRGLIKGLEQIREDTGKVVMSLEEASELNSQGINEYKKQNYGKAFEYFLEAAKNDDAWGMYNVGTAYRDAEGVNLDLEKAFFWIKKAAQKGIVDAMFETGKMYYRGEGTKKDVIQSFAWCKKAAEDKKEPHAWAMNWVGHFYHDGEGVMQDLENAARYHMMAMKEGITDSVFALAFMYAYGEGVEHNPERAIGLCDLVINTAKENDDSELLNNATVILRRLAHIFNEEYEYLSKREINSGELVSEETQELYRKYLDCLKRAGELGNVEAKKEFDKEVDSCFITTAVCSSFGKADDCYELSMFRKFRDKWLINQPDGESLITEYYNIAPRIVRKINTLETSKEIYMSIWEKYLKICLFYIEQEKFMECKERYILMIKDLINRF